jgi:hypothetical protein
MRVVVMGMFVIMRVAVSFGGVYVFLVVRVPVIV